MLIFNMAKVTNKKVCAYTGNPPGSQNLSSNSIDDNMMSKKAGHITILM